MRFPNDYSKIVYFISILFGVDFDIILTILYFRQKLFQKYIIQKINYISYHYR